jgi:hypothetical protein
MNSLSVWPVAYVLRNEVNPPREEKRFNATVRTIRDGIPVLPDVVVVIMRLFGSSHLVVITTRGIHHKELIVWCNEKHGACASEVSGFPGLAAPDDVVAHTILNSWDVLSARLRSWPNSYFSNQSM